MIVMHYCFIAVNAHAPPLVAVRGAFASFILTPKEVSLCVRSVRRHPNPKIGNRTLFARALKLRPIEKKIMPYYFLFLIHCFFPPLFVAPSPEARRYHAP
jgi:hypothetical protein